MKTLLFGGMDYSDAHPVLMILGAVLCCVVALIVEAV